MIVRVMLLRAGTRNRGVSIGLKTWSAKTRGTYSVL